jgi:NAD(P)-dependent dehydrogenase (short-subunit alcohol dehydrogenase family)
VQVQEMFKTVEDEIGPVEVCVFNVGGNVKFPLEETTSRVYYKVWEMACFSGFLTGKEAVKYMKPRGRGTIIFTGATASTRGASGFSAFSGAKFGLRSLAQSMAREFGPQASKILILEECFCHYFYQISEQCSGDTGLRILIQLLESEFSFSAHTYFPFLCNDLQF